MNPLDPKIISILEDLLELEGAERERALRAASAGDPELAEHLRSLLAHDEQPWEFFDGLAPERSSAEKGGAPPKTFGPYRLIRELGRGGQAVVWLAEDTRLERRVALKLLGMTSWLANDDSRIRFEREGLAAARLDHPGICRVYEVGSADGLPYIAMQFVEGITLAAWIEQRATAFQASPGSRGGTSGSGSATRERDDIQHATQLIEKVARALHTAHEAGILHRDIKPANVMLTKDGEPVLLDFGLARDEEQELASLTHSGGVLGTPAYMAPEQIEGQRAAIGRPTDVYALGVLLFEALTFVRPFEEATIERLWAKIRDSQAVDPRKIRRAIPEDLSIVLNMALEKEPVRRYATAEAFADDLKAILEHRPIEARPASLVTRASKLLRRNRSLALSVAAVMLALLLGILFTTREMLRARDAEELAEQRRLHANERTVFAEERASDAEAVAQFIGSLLQKGNRINRGGESLSFREALDMASQRIEDEVGHRPRVAAELHRVFGEDYGLLGAEDQALEHLQRAVALRMQHEGPSAHGTMQAQVSLGIYLVRLRKLQEAQPVLATALAHADSHLDSDPALVARLYQQEGERLHELGQSELAEAPIRRALAIYEGLGRDDNVLADMRISLSRVLRRAGAFDECETLIRLAIPPIARRFGPHSTQVANSRVALALILRRQGRNKEALDELDLAIAIKQKLFGFPSREMLIPITNRASILYALFRYDEAEAAFRRSFLAHEELYGPDDWRVSVPLTGLARCAEYLGDCATAIEHHRRIDKLLQLGMPPGHPRRVRAKVAYLRALIDAKQTAEAGSALAFLEAGAQGPAAAATVALLSARIAIIDRRFEDAHRALKKVSSTETTSTEQAVSVAIATAELAFAEGRMEAAEQSFAHAESLRGPPNPAATFSAAWLRLRRIQTVANAETRRELALAPETAQLIEGLDPRTKLRRQLEQERSRAESASR